MRLLVFPLTLTVSVEVYGSSIDPLQTYQQSQRHYQSGFYSRSHIDVSLEHESVSEAFTEAGSDNRGVRQDTEFKDWKSVGTSSGAWAFDTFGDVQASSTPNVLKYSDSFLRGQQTLGVFSDEDILYPVCRRLWAFR